MGQDDILSLSDGPKDQARSKGYDITCTRFYRYGIISGGRGPKAGKIGVYITINIVVSRCRVENVTAIIGALEISDDVTMANSWDLFGSVQKRAHWWTAKAISRRVEVLK